MGPFFLNSNTEVRETVTLQLVTDTFKALEDISIPDATLEQFWSLCLHEDRASLGCEPWQDLIWTGWFIWLFGSGELEIEASCYLLLPCRIWYHTIYHIVFFTLFECFELPISSLDYAICLRLTQSSFNMPVLSVYLARARWLKVTSNPFRLFSKDYPR